MRPSRHTSFRAANVFAAHSPRQRVKVFAFAALASLAFAAGAAVAQTSGESNENSPGLQKVLFDIANGRAVSATVKLPLQVGFFNGATALYITPEVGVDPSAGQSVVTTAQSIAKGFNANFIPQNFATLPNSPAVDDIFVFTNFTQGNVLASAPSPAGPGNTDPNYSPIWQISLVTWNPNTQPRALTSQADINAAVQAGKVTVQKTPIIVECSVIFTPQGGLLPASSVQESRPDNDDNNSNNDRR